MTPPETLTHRLAPLAAKPPGQLLIHEVYRSIQGESTFAGLPCVFVRLAVCGQRCRWCDTPHAFREGTVESPDSVLAKVLSYLCPLVEITGGEPLHQSEVLPLMTRLADEGLTVLLETSGALDVTPVDQRVHIIMDLKCPDSGECENNRWKNLDLLKASDEIKFVMASGGDFEGTAEVIRAQQLDRRFTVLLSPVFGELQPIQLAEWLLASGLEVRMQLQMHKYVWDPQTRGV